MSHYGRQTYSFEYFCIESAQIYKWIRCVFININSVLFIGLIFFFVLIKIWSALKLSAGTKV